MINNITVPERFIHTMMTVVAVRTQMILELKALNEGEKRAAIDDMIARVMKDVRSYSALG